MIILRYIYMIIYIYIYIYVHIYIIYIYIYIYNQNTPPLNENVFLQTKIDSNRKIMLITLHKNTSEDYSINQAKMKKSRSSIFQMLSKAI